MKPASRADLNIRFYSALLYMYPSDFRREFAEEMQEVFSEAAEEAAGKSAFALAALYLRELSDLPGVVLRAHRQARQNAYRAALHGLVSPPELTWKQLLVILAVFLLPATMLLTGPAHRTDGFAGASTALLFLLIMIIAGWLRGTPLRSAPYFGIVVTITGYLYVFQWIAGMVSPTLISNYSPGPWDPSTYLLLEVISTGMMWLMLFCLTLLVIALLALFNRFQPIFQHVDQDWTLLSYILYGESVFAMLLLFTSQRHSTSYVVASLLCLVAGAWFYLRSNRGGRRVLALLAGLSLAMWVYAFGAAADSFANDKLQELSWLYWRFERWGEVVQLLIVWLWMVLALILPTLIARGSTRLKLRGE